VSDDDALTIPKMLGGNARAWRYTIGLLRQLREAGATAAEAELILAAMFRAGREPGEAED